MDNFFTQSNLDRYMNRKGIRGMQVVGRASFHADYVVFRGGWHEQEGRVVRLSLLDL